MTGSVPTVTKGACRKYRILDLFCCAGGAGEGYRRAGFDVTGVDINPQPHNPHRFIQGDALEYLRDHGHEYDAIHASPPCQGYSKTLRMNPHLAGTYPELIDGVRMILESFSCPWVIENVEGAPLQSYSGLFGGHGVMLCGSMFGLGVDRGYLRRHRIFETSFGLPQLQCNHDGPAVGVYGHGSCAGKPRMLAKDEAAIALGIDWMTRDEMAQAIPPAYTEWIGKRLMGVCQSAEEAT